MVAAVKPSAVILYNLGLAMFYGGKLKEARDTLGQALDEGASAGIAEGEVYYYIIQSYAGEGDLDQARALFAEKGEKIPGELHKELETLVRS